MTELAYPAVVFKNEDEEGGGYVAFAIDLVGAMACGDTPEEAVTELADAVCEWIEEAHRLGREIPLPGSVSNASANENEALHHLIAMQDELIHRQKEAIKGLEKQVADAVRQLKAREDVNTFSVPGVWPVVKAKGRLEARRVSLKN